MEEIFKNIKGPEKYRNVAIEGKETPCSPSGEIGLEGNDTEQSEHMFTDFENELNLMTSLVDQIGRDNTAATRGMAKIRLASMIQRIGKFEF